MMSARVRCALYPIYVACVLLTACHPDSTTQQENDPVDMGMSILDSPRDMVSMPSDSHTDAGGDTNELDELSWTMIVSEWPAALTSVHGRAHDDVWVVGARDTMGPTVLHWDGVRWRRHMLPGDVDVWWVHALPEGEVLLAGSDGALFSGDATRGFQRQHTPSLARHTLFGVWSDPLSQRAYAVGGIGARSGFIWERMPGEDAWHPLPLPADMPKLVNGAHAGIFKVQGDGRGTVWFVGARGSVLRREGTGPLELIETPTTQTLFTLSYDAKRDRMLAVGGGSQGLLLDLSQSPVRALTLPPSTPLLQGIASDDRGEVVVVGARATTLRASSMSFEESGWTHAEVEQQVDSLHAVWIDPDQGVWSVGGDVLSASLSRGVLLYRGLREVSAPELPTPQEEPAFECPTAMVRRGAHSHVARRWIEQNLQAIRRAIPEPGVHARNLYHVSLALFEVLAASSTRLDTLILPMDPDRVLSPKERDSALSYAAHTVLTHRYKQSAGGAHTLACLDATLRDMDLDPLSTDSIALWGRSIGDAVIQRFADDGALESSLYQDPSYTPSNPPLEVDEPGLDVDDPTRWQPLDLAIAVSQNGIGLGSGVQGYIGSHWGDVEPFALTRESEADLYFPVATPYLHDLDALAPDVVDVIQKTSWLTPHDEQLMDTSPAGYGNNVLGEDRNPGHALNPFTARPYRSVWSTRRDFGRVLAEYWADGPDSETPPGHWNVLANEVMDHPDFDWRDVPGIEVESELEYALHTYLLLNGALHDAAIAAWQLKRHTESARPITLIRWMAMQGQRSDPGAASYHVLGLPLVDGLIELITTQSSEPGSRHAHLAPYVGELAILSWPGAPGDAARRSAPQAWIRAQEWSPYQPRTFVTPAFPGYISGHSTFSRAAAEVLGVMTGSPFFPGGLHEHVAQPAAALHFEQGPDQQVRLQWATYFDAADQAGQSRLWGGIHILPDDHDGRHIGALTGRSALVWGQQNVRTLRDLLP